MSELPNPFPTEADYNAAIDKVSADFEAGGGVSAFIQKFVTAELRRTQSMHLFMNYVTSVASILNPVDRSTGEFTKDDTPTTNAVIHGAAAGLLIVRNVHGGRVRASDIIDKKIHFEYEEGDVLHARHQLASQVIQLGEQGLALFGSEGADKVEVWEMRTIEDVTAQPFFRRACGMIALNAYEVNVALDLKEFEEQIEGAHDIDWDNWETALGL